MVGRNEEMTITEGLLDKDPSLLSRHLAEFAHLAIVTLDESMTITDCNQGFLRLLGITEKPTHTNLRDLVEPVSLKALSLPKERGRQRMRLNVRGPSGTVNGLTCDLYRMDPGYILFGELAHLAESEIVARISSLNDQLTNLTRDLHKSNFDLNKSLTLQRQTESALQASHRFLEAANRHTEMAPLLKEFVSQVKGLSGCEAVGMRILDQDGNIPYEDAIGFPARFHQVESRLSIRRDECMCINVVRGSADSRLPFYTPGGSFYMNGTSRLLSEFTEEERGKTRNVCNEFGYESVALVPIRLGNRILGLIHVADRREDAVPLELVETLERIAMQLGTALQRVQSENALRTAHDELELRVEQRTAELANANEKLQLEIEERERAEEELRTSEKELRLLSAQLLTAQEDERRRISRELHDTIGQSLSAVKFTVENVLQEIGAGGSGKGVRPLESAIRMVQGAVEEVRRIQRNLRPPTLDDLGLLATISWFCREFEGVYSEIRIDREIDLEEMDVPHPLKIVIYRVMQEALNNVAKHSRTKTVHLSLRKTDSRVEMEIQDHGVGFDPQEAFARKESERGLGLFSMKERTELSNGCFSIQASTGAGTTIRASWPGGP
jgi:signal transduction histidine kinase